MRNIVAAALLAFAASSTLSRAFAGAKSCVVERSKSTGRYDPAQAKGCEKSCAVRVHYKESELAPQPEVAIGRLARCPVSGVVFRAGEGGPAAPYRGKTWRFCCKACEKMFRRAPARFVG